MRQLAVTWPHRVPSIRLGNTIFVATDIGGDHRGATHQAIAVLLADLERCEGWWDTRGHVRARHLSDGRRLAYKSLRDRKRLAALEGFLEAADSIPGLLATVLVSRKLDTMFQAPDPTVLLPAGFPTAATWKPRTYERMMRVVHLVSFFIAGLSRPGQNVLWITDEDEIVANENKLREVTVALGNVASTYLPHDLGHLRVGSTRLDSGSRELEDLASIPDISAGALTDAFAGYDMSGVTVSRNVIAPPPQGLSQKARGILNWFATDRKPLKRLVILLDEDSASRSVSVRVARFHGSNDHQP